MLGQHRDDDVARVEQDVANEMDQKDSLIWFTVQVTKGSLAFTCFAIETIQDLIEIHKANPNFLKRSTDPL